MYIVLPSVCKLTKHRVVSAHPPRLTNLQRYRSALRKVKKTDFMFPATPLGRSLPPITSGLQGRSTRIMSILNVTPDSFSDGGKNFNLDEASLAARITSHIAAGATIIDVGGQSTRPGAVQVSPEEELSRILPAIRIIRSLKEADNIAISVDTYRARVAEEAIRAGADIVNDVSAGTMDRDMFPTVARLGCTVCLMHMRGEPETMDSLADYGKKGVIKSVAIELEQRIAAAEEAGIRRWRIIVDPGIGFAKNQEHNLEILRNLEQLYSWPDLKSLPFLVGTSRKRFIGNVTGTESADQRAWGTAAAITAAIHGGADILRVHDVEEMAQVAKMADALYRV